MTVMEGSDDELLCPLKIAIEHYLVKVWDYTCEFRKINILSRYNRESISEATVLLLGIVTTL